MYNDTPNMRPANLGIQSYVQSNFIALIFSYVQRYVQTSGICLHTRPIRHRRPHTSSDVHPSSVQFLSILHPFIFWIHPYIQLTIICQYIFHVQLYIQIFKSNSRPIAYIGQRMKSNNSIISNQEKQLFTIDTHLLFGN